MKGSENIKVYPQSEKLAEGFADELFKTIKGSLNETSSFNIALSGGNTPKMLFTVLAEKFLRSLPWDKIHFFWGDERCVAPYNMESNFGMARRYLLDIVPIPADNIHRIKGENAPYREVLRYSNEISKHVPEKNGLPAFDLIMLGMGEDGHTASIFPDQMKLLHSTKICAVSKHPETGQHRITLTGPVINNASNVCFLVSGNSKAEVLKYIFNGSNKKMEFPAAHIHPMEGKLFWYLDEEAASKLSR